MRPSCTASATVTAETGRPSPICGLFGPWVFWHIRDLTMRFILNTPVCRRISTLRWLILLAGFALLAPTVRAQVTYLGEIGGMIGHTPFLLTANAPFDLSDPLYNSSTTHKPWVVTSQSYYTIDPATGAASDPGTLPFSVKLTTDSRVSFAGRNTSNPTALILGFRKTLYIVSLGGPTPVLTDPAAYDGLPVRVAVVDSMAAVNRTTLTIIGDGYFSSVNSLVTETDEWGFRFIPPFNYFEIAGGTGQREFSLSTHYHAYGPNGLVYLLDYGNNRMQILDPQNAFAYVSEFTLNPSVTTANMQFAIGVNGNVYLGDGQGGGSAYDADGDFLGAFVLPVDPTSPGSGGAPYLTTDASGRIYILDGAGNHIYQDLTVIPEPSTCGLIAGAGTALLALYRRRRTRFYQLSRLDPAPTR